MHGPSSWQIFQRFYLLRSTVSVNMRRHYICNVLSHLITRCSATDRKQVRFRDHIWWTLNSFTRRNINWFINGINRYTMYLSNKWYHYNDVIMSTIASQITSLMIVYSTVYSDADQRKHQRSAPLAFVRGIDRGPVNSPHKGPVTREMFPFDDVIMSWLSANMSPRSQKER